MVSSNSSRLLTARALARAPSDDDIVVDNRRRLGTEISAGKRGEAQREGVCTDGAPVMQLRVASLTDLLGRSNMTCVTLEKLSIKWSTMPSESSYDVAVDANLLTRLDRAPVTRTLRVGIGVVVLVWLLESFDIGLVSVLILVLGPHWDLSSGQIGLLGASGTIGCSSECCRPAGWPTSTAARRCCWSVPRCSPSSRCCAGSP